MIEITEQVAIKVRDTIKQGLCGGLGTPRPGEMCVEAAVCFALGLEHGDDPGCVDPRLRTIKIGLNDSCWSSKETRAKGLVRLGLAQLGTKGTLDSTEFLKRVCLMSVKTVVPAALRSAASIHPIEKHKLAMLANADICESATELDDAAHAARAAAQAARAAAADADAHAADVAARAADAATDAARAADAAACAAHAARAAARAAHAAHAAQAAQAHAADAADAAADAADAAADAAARAARAAADAAHAATDADADKLLSDIAENIVQILIQMNAPGCQWLYLSPI